MTAIYDDDIDHGMAMVDYNDSLVLRKLYSDCMTKFICVNDTAERNLMLNFFLAERDLARTDQWRSYINVVRCYI